MPRITNNIIRNDFGIVFACSLLQNHDVYAYYFLFTKPIEVQEYFLVTFLKFRRYDKFIILSQY